MRGIVFGSTLDVARDRLNRMSADYERFWNVEIERIISSRHEYKMIFSNGDVWEAVELNKYNGCGKRCNIALIDFKIPKEERWRAEVCVVKRPYGAIGYY